MMRNGRVWAMGLVCVLALAGSVRTAWTQAAGLGFDELFTDRMVLQRGVPLPVWGVAPDGTPVQVSFAGQAVATVAEQGQWRVELAPLRASNEGRTLRVSSGTLAVELEDVLVGDVWLAGGQSNMVWRLDRHDNDPADLARITSNSRIRLYMVHMAHLDEPSTQVPVSMAYEAAWQRPEGEYAMGFSTIGLHFADRLARELDVPIGVILSAVGGTEAEAWTPLEALKANAQTAKLLRRHRAYLDRQPPDAYDRWETARRNWATDQRAERGPRPQMPPGPWNWHRPAALYNGMIAPLQPFAIRGVIWYQGESNTHDGANGSQLAWPGRTAEYEPLFRTLISSWRAAWDAQLPFLFVQLAPFHQPRETPVDESWPWLRESQARVDATVPDTAMAVIIDKGQSNDIHPDGKDVVAERLALLALAEVYGRPIEAEGPRFERMDVQGDRALLTFSNTGKGLEARELHVHPSKAGVRKAREMDDEAREAFMRRHTHLVRQGDVSGFAVAGADREWHWAEAEIHTQTIVVWSPEVDQIEAVRYGWADFPLCNVYNSHGLPLAPFRTDDWPARP